MAIEFLYDENILNHTIRSLHAHVILLEKENLEFTDIRDICTVIKFD